jgi:putative iron-dependent peroxidase
MTRPQSAILPDGNRHAIFITAMIDEGSANLARVRRTAAAFPAAAEAVGAMDSAGGPRGAPLDAPLGALGFGADIWDRLFPGRRPAGLRPFRAYEDGGRSAPATPADLFIHIRGDRHDLNFELARRTMAELGESVAPVEEIHGFRYLDSRDLTGFVDGTENPTGEDRARVALVGGEDPAFAGGSYLSLQRYIHDLASWNELPVAEQERIIARTKADDVEFPSEDKPPFAHIKRVSLKEDGKSLEILRHSMPYGTSREHGLYFVAYGADPDTFDKMLGAMVMDDAAGHHDRLLDYTRPVTGALFFVPSRDWLEGAGA